RVGAEELADLDREDPEAAGRAPHQHVVARLDLRAPDQHPVGGEVGETVRRRLLPAELLRLLHELLRLHLGELRERAPARLVAPDLLLRAGHWIEAVTLGALAARLVAVDDHLVARLPATHFVSH